jgi:hypothetical protein
VLVVKLPHQYYLCPLHYCGLVVSAFCRIVWQVILGSVATRLMVLTYRRTPRVVLSHRWTTFFDSDLSDSGDQASTTTVFPEESVGPKDTSGHEDTSDHEEPAEPVQPNYNRKDTDDDEDDKDDKDDKDFRSSLLHLSQVHHRIPHLRQQNNVRQRPATSSRSRFCL